VHSKWRRTVESRVHATNVDEQTHHRHVDGGGTLRQQLVLENLAALAALCHGVEVDVGKRVAGCAVRLLGEGVCVVLEDELEEVVLDVLAPERDAVIFFEMLDFVAAVDGRDAAVGVAARRRCRGRVMWVRSVAIGGGAGATSIDIVRGGCVGQRGRALRVVHGGFCGEDVAEAVARVDLVGSRGRARVHGGSGDSGAVADVAQRDGGRVGGTKLRICRAGSVTSAVRYPELRAFAASIAGHE
jgi:hypothetical protein